MHSSWINGCEWFLNIMKGPCADGLLKIDCHLCHYALSKDELRRHAELVILRGSWMGGRWSGAHQGCSLAPLQEHFGKSKQRRCRKGRVVPPPLIKLLNRTPHLIMASRRAGRRGRASSWGQEHGAPPRRTLLPANYTGPRRSQGSAEPWFIVLLRPPNEPQQP